MGTLSDTRDREALTVRYYMEGIHFDILPAEQGRRIAVSIQAACHGIRSEIMGSKDPGLTDLEFAETCEEIALTLSELANPPSAGDGF
jgi:hypothetical protein